MIPVRQGGLLVDPLGEGMCLTWEARGSLEPWRVRRRKPGMSHQEKPRQTQGSRGTAGGGCLGGMGHGGGQRQGCWRQGSDSAAAQGLLTVYRALVCYGFISFNPCSCYEVGIVPHC